MPPGKNNPRTARPGADDPRTKTPLIRVEVRYFDNGQWLPLPDAEVTVIHTTTTVQNPKPKMTDINGIAEFPPMPIGLINFEVFKDLYGPAPAVGQPPKVARWTEMVNCSSVVARG